MEWLSRQSKRLILEMSVGIVLYNVVLGILAWVLLPGISYPVMPVLKGLLAGAVGAVLMLVHIAVMTERVLDSREEAYANRMTVVHSIIRKVVYAAAVFACWRWLEADMLAMVIGSMGMKAGAYLQPLIRKIFGGEEAAPGEVQCADDAEPKAS